MSSEITAITISHPWRDESLTPPLTGLFLSVPSPCIVSAIPEKYQHREIPSEQNKDAPIFNQTVSNYLAGEFHFPSNLFCITDPFIDCAKPNPQSPLRSPLLFPTGRKNLPPTYFAIAGVNRGRDMGLLYEEILREESGVKTRLNIFVGLIHAFWNILPSTEFSKGYRRKADEALADLAMGKKGAIQGF
jgi:acetyl esterase/lipase